MARRHQRDKRDAKLARLVGGHIRTLRNERGFSLDELATRAHLDKGQLGRIERGEGATTLGGYLDIAAGMDLRLPDLFSGLNIV